MNRWQVISERLTEQPLRGQLLQTQLRQVLDLPRLQSSFPSLHQDEPTVHTGQLPPPSGHDGQGQHAHARTRKPEPVVRAVQLMRIWELCKWPPPRHEALIMNFFLTLSKHPQSRSLFRGKAAGREGSAPNRSSYPHTSHSLGQWLWDSRVVAIHTQRPESPKYLRSGP